jgi:MFS family permease
LPVRGGIEGFTVAELGLLGTSWATGFILGCVLVPAMVRRVGHIRSYGALASVAAITILLNLLFIDPLVWIPLRALSGFCFAGAAMVVESWLNERATRENRGTVFSVYQMVNFAASTCGQLLLIIQPPTDFFLMEYFLQQLINGLTLGSIYGLIAIGYTMVYGIIGMINFAHGDIFMIGAFIALITFHRSSAIGITAHPAAHAADRADRRHAAHRGLGLDRRALAYRPLRGSFRLAPLITAIGMSIVLQNFVQIAQGARVKPLPPIDHRRLPIVDA